jgi:hypothetical protein
MAYRYYESKNEDDPKFEFGKITLDLKKKKERFPGLIIRKILAKRESFDERIVTHV